MYEYWIGSYEYAKDMATQRSTFYKGSRLEKMHVFYLLKKKKKKKKNEEG